MSGGASVISQGQLAGASTGSTPFIGRGRRSIKCNSFGNLLCRFSLSPPDVRGVWTVNRLPLAAVVRAAPPARFGWSAAGNWRLSLSRAGVVAGWQHVAGGRRQESFPFTRKRSGDFRRVSRNFPITVTFARRRWFAERAKFWAGRSIRSWLKLSKLVLRH